MSVNYRKHSSDCSFQRECKAYKCESAKPRCSGCRIYLFRGQLGACLKLECCSPGCQLGSASCFQGSVTAGSILSQLLLFTGDLLKPAIPAHTTQDILQGSCVCLSCSTQYIYHSRGQHSNALFFSLTGPYCCEAMLTAVGG